MSSTDINKIFQYLYTQGTDAEYGSLPQSGYVAWVVEDIFNPQKGRAHVCAYGNTRDELMGKPEIGPDCPASLIEEIQQICASSIIYFDIHPDRDGAGCTLSFTQNFIFSPEFLKGQMPWFTTYLFMIDPGSALAELYRLKLKDLEAQLAEE
jgi:hypothetical protein